LLVLQLAALAPARSYADDARVVRGGYLARAAGCISCHTDKKAKGAPFAGGRAIKTPFGIYYSPNITSDTETGIGRWSNVDFLNALQRGLRPDGAHYFPIFPYTTYTKMQEADALDIKAYLFSVRAVRRENRAHDVWPPFGWRWVVSAWKWLFFEEGRFKRNLKHDAVRNRGAYLVEALAHCGECHTPRNFAGALDRTMWLAGTEDGPEGEISANITPDFETGIGDWSVDQIAFFLKVGTKPDYETAEGAMAEAIEDGLSHLSDADLEAIAWYIKSLPPIRKKVAK
jgi:mono/diheme cytochrome c family protein